MIIRHIIRTTTTSFLDNTGRSVLRQTPLNRKISRMSPPPVNPSLGSPITVRAKVLGSLTVLTGGGVFAGCYLTEKKSTGEAAKIYEPGPIKPEELKPEKTKNVTSILPDKTISTALVHHNQYQNHPEDVRALIAGGTGDAAYHNLLYFLKIGVQVTITSRTDNPLEIPEMKLLVDSLTDEERQLIKYVKTPTNEEDWLKLLEEVSAGAKKVHFNNLLGVPVQENNDKTYQEALERSTQIARAAARFEKKQKGVKIQLCIASSPSIDMLEENKYAKFKYDEEISVIKNGPENTTIIRIPYLESPDAPLRKSTIFGIKELAYLPLQILLGSPKMMLPVASGEDIGKLFAVSIEGKIKVTAVDKMTSQEELTEAIAGAYNNNIRKIVLHPKIAEKMCNLINIGHATEYAYAGILKQMENPLDISDPNFKELIDRPPLDPVEEYNKIANQGQILSPLQIRYLVRSVREKYGDRFSARLEETLVQLRPELLVIAFQVVSQHSEVIPEVLKFALELYNIAEEEGLASTPLHHLVAHTIYEAVFE